MKEDIKKLSEKIYKESGGGDGLARISDEEINQILQLFKQYIADKAPQKKTEGILGVLATKHRDGAVNEGYNKAIQEYRKALEEGLK